eukprot:341438_1
MTASNEQTAVIIDKPNQVNKVSIRRPQNGKTHHILKTKIGRISSSAMEYRATNHLLSPNKMNHVNRESSLSLLIPLINGDTTTETKDEESHTASDIDSEEKQSFVTPYKQDIKHVQHRKYRPKYLKITKKRKKPVMWNLICPYSISDRFERVEIDRNKCKTCTRGFLYSFLIKPHSLNRVFGIVTPKRIPNELDQKYMNFAMHYPEYEQRVMVRS